ncbi:hypothetical protein [Corynebacterium frankenforstense]|uniref:hypothetical protein n=1 Tax=Corynebacterium frankenforstense TaxID=1230998 RepID=UPI0026F28B1B|nr:hypothetical protein [Corynebacterium frankenforstense]
MASDEAWKELQRRASTPEFGGVTSETDDELDDAELGEELINPNASGAKGRPGNNPMMPPMMMGGPGAGAGGQAGAAAGQLGASGAANMGAVGAANAAGSMRGAALPNATAAGTTGPSGPAGLGGGALPVSGLGAGLPGGVMAAGGAPATGIPAGWEPGDPILPGDPRHPGGGLGPILSTDPAYRDLVPGWGGQGMSTPSWGNELSTPSASAPGVAAPHIDTPGHAAPGTRAGVGNWPAPWAPGVGASQGLGARPTGHEPPTTTTPATPQGVSPSSLAAHPHGAGPSLTSGGVTAAPGIAPAGTGSGESSPSAGTTGSGGVAGSGASVSDGGPSGTRGGSSTSFTVDAAVLRQRAKDWMASADTVSSTNGQQPAPKRFGFAESMMPSTRDFAGSVEGLTRQSSGEFSDIAGKLKAAADAYDNQELASVRASQQIGRTQ